VPLRGLHITDRDGIHTESDGANDVPFHDSRLGSRGNNVVFIVLLSPHATFEAGFPPPLGRREARRTLWLVPYSGPVLTFQDLIMSIIASCTQLVASSERRGLSGPLNRSTQG
jgi:hypothetical protein